VVKVLISDSNGDEDDEFHTEREICKQVSKNLSECFRLVFTAKCHEVKLFDEIRFLGATDYATQILESADDFPPDACPLLEEAAIPYVKLSQEEVATSVTIDDFQHC